MLEMTTFSLLLLQIKFVVNVSETTKRKKRIEVMMMRRRISTYENDVVNWSGNTHIPLYSQH